MMIYFSIDFKPFLPRGKKGSWSKPDEADQFDQAI
jgi:hypothetical protein